MFKIQQEDISSRDAVPQEDSKTKCPNEIHIPPKYLPSFGSHLKLPIFNE